LYSTYSSFLVINVCNQGKTLCSPCTCTTASIATCYVSVRRLLQPACASFIPLCRTLIAYVTIKLSVHTQHFTNNCISHCIHLPCLVCLQSVVRGVCSHLSCGHKGCSLPEVSVTSFLPLQFFVFVRLLESNFLTHIKGLCFTLNYQIGAEGRSDSVRAGQ